MTLTLYIFRRFIPPFLFGAFLFMFVLLLDKFFDLLDLIFNKGVHLLIVGKIFLLFLPTLVPLTFPMGVLLACLVTFGNLSEENELTAIRAGGISLIKVFWLVPAFALVLSVAMVPFNTRIAPLSSQAFRTLYEKIIQADPLINIEEKKFFSIRNIRLFAERVDNDTSRLQNIFVYQIPEDDRPADRIFADRGRVETSPTDFRLILQKGQLQRFDPNYPTRLTHASFQTYEITVPLNVEKMTNTTRYRNIPSRELKELVEDLKSKNLPTAPIEAENSLRYAIAFAPLALVLVGIPLATVLRRGGRSFSFGVTIVLIFVYYLMLILGLTLAEKNVLPPDPALWIGNAVCVLAGAWFVRKMVRQ